VERLGGTLTWLGRGEGRGKEKKRKLEEGLIARVDLFEVGYEGRKYGGMSRRLCLHYLLCNMYGIAGLPERHRHYLSQAASEIRHKPSDL
jgi:hypothetical protein